MNAKDLLNKTNLSRRDAIMVAFNYKDLAPHWIRCAFDLYILKPMYQYLMYTGRF